jgi:hypothetical protein
LPTTSFISKPKSVGFNLWWSQLLLAWGWVGITLGSIGDGGGFFVGFGTVISDSFSQMISLLVYQTVPSSLS